MNINPSTNNNSMNWKESCMKVGDVVKFKSSGKGFTLAEILCIRRDSKKVYYDVLLVKKGKMLAGLSRDLLEEFEDKKESGSEN